MLKKLKGYLEVKGADVEGIASTENPDRMGEVIKQDGWDLEMFKKNPVLMASHRYSDFPIGRVTDITVDGKKLTFKAIFSQETQAAKEAYALVKEGILKAFSVGFIPREYDTDNQNTITKAELLEISLVSVPANPFAIVTAKSMEHNQLAQEMVKEWLLDEKNKKDAQEMENKEEIKADMNRLKKIRNKMDKMSSDMADMVGMMDDMMNNDGKNIASEDGNVKLNGEESEEVESRELDVKLLQRVTGHLQELCRIAKKGGNKK